MNLLADLEEFVLVHHLYGGLTGDATEPALLTVAYSCGVPSSGR
jgi:hypothetical protein